MKIQYFGTAAVEGVPALFCNCRVCKLSRALGGRNMRSRSQALINGELLLEFNADTVWHYHKYAFDWEDVCACLITHSHSDHLYPADLENAKRAFTHEHRTVNFYAGKSGYDALNLWAAQKDSGASVTLVEAGKPFLVRGKHAYRIMPLPANHAESSTPLIYAIECGGKRMLYAHDTGLFPDRTWELLGGEGYFDYLSLDCTGCLSPDRDWVNGHMSVGTVIKVLGRMKGMRLADEKTVVVLNHFSHNGGMTYDELSQAVKDLGFLVSYDGMEVEF